MPRKNIPFRQPVYVIGPSICYLPLTKGQLCCLDWEDGAWAAQWDWFAQWDRHSKAYRPLRNVQVGSYKQIRAYLYRELICAPAEFTVDHKNNAPLDCRKANLRLATQNEQAKNRRLRSDNTSGIKGVTRDKNAKEGTRCWQAKIDGRSLGFFFTADEARIVRNAAAESRHSNFRNDG